MEKQAIIAIDGPAGSGKSTVARNVAKRLGLLYIDTGAMYRALTLKAIKHESDFTDKDILMKLAQDTDIELRETGEGLKVFLDKEDVTEAIRTLDVTNKVKHLASLNEVRENMVRLQRKLGLSSRGAVLEGRDIGTVVFPDATIKFYLDADLKTRVTRRYDELKEKGFSISAAQVKEDLKARDTSDMTRSVGPLKKAEDALVIDTTDLTIDEVTDRLLKTIEKRRKRKE